MSKLFEKIRAAWNRDALISFFGVTGMGFFLSFLILAGYGTDPCTFMNRSIALKIGWTLGNWQLVLNIALLLFVIAVNRKLIGFGTVFNMVLIGYYADLFDWLWARCLPDSIFTEQPARAIVFIITLLGFVLSAAVYMNAGAGLSPYDATAKIFTERFPKAPFFILRIIFDFSAVGIGLIAGGRPTVGIILIAIFLGPVITLVGRLMKRVP